MLIKAILVGQSGVGKTSLFNRLTGAIDAATPTYGVNFGYVYIDTLKIQLWDFTGQKDYQPARADFVKNMNIIIYVFDLSNRASFDALASLAKEFTNSHAHKILLGNKTDCIAAVDTEEATRWAISIGATQYSEVSSLNDSVNEALRQYATYSRFCEKPYVEPQINTNFINTEDVENVEDAEDCIKPLQTITFDVWGFTIKIQYNAHVGIWDLMGCPRRKKHKVQ